MTLSEPTTTVGGILDRFRLLHVVITAFRLVGGWENNGLLLQLIDALVQALVVRLVIAVRLDGVLLLVLLR